ncbi:MAG: hypothetical protein WD834_08280 [Actinomycetota bacterium]
MTPFARVLVAAFAFAMLASACTSTSNPNPTPSSGAEPSIDIPTSPEVVPQPEQGPGSALAALERLCTIVPPDIDGASEVPAEGPTPPAIAKVMGELEQIRGFGFSARVVAEPVTQQDIADGYTEYIETYYPEEFYTRRSLAWQTIGVIPQGTNIRDELLEYGSTQVIGYYDTVTGELVFLGQEDPTPLERVTLAHELTHAIDDQRFGLEKVDVLGAECREEELQATLGLVEGNATFFMLRWARTFLTVEEQIELSAEAAAQQPPPSDIPPFIDAMQQWPYTAGLRFITAIEGEGGLEAVDAAFLDMPVSSEQILHPERYPNDVPTPVDVPDLASELGAGWEDLDVQPVGEIWLDVALRLRLDGLDASQASAGWDGGIYRAWSDGDRVAIVLATAWDSERDAEEFAAQMQRWITAGETPAEVLPAEGTSVRVLFATDAEALGALAAAA